jgi:histidinol-phosphate aminotransferase
MLGSSPSAPIPGRPIPGRPRPGGSSRAAFDLAGIRLTSNENRLGLPESVQEAVRQAFFDAHLYPDDSNEDLTVALAARHGIPVEGVVHSHGSTEILRMVAAAHAVGKAQMRLVIADPTFEQLIGYAAPFDPDLALIPLRPDDGAHDLVRMREAAERWDGPVLVYICNPNNPTGTLTPLEPLKEWIRAAPLHHLFLVDEAYHDFVEAEEYHSLDGWAWERPNVIVLRTFSKAFAMAGLCVGYAVAHPETILRLWEFKTGRGPSHLSCRGALAALEDHAFLERSRETIRTSRSIVYGVLDELGLVYLPSSANFVMHEVGGPVEIYVQRMLEAGFQVGRPFPAYPHHNRITLGLPEEMRAWADVLRGFRERGWL